MASNNSSDQTLQSKYNSVVIDGYLDGGITHPLEIINEIWKNPSIAEHIKYITFIDGDWHNFKPDDVKDEIKELARLFQGPKGQRFLGDFVRGTAVSKHPALLQRCLDEIIVGKQSSAFVLLLVGLPQLERLRFSRPRWDMELLSTVFQDPQFSSKLSTVECYQSDTEGYVSVEDYAIFALAPSVRFLRGKTVGEFFSSSDVPGWETAVSQLERIELSASAIHYDAVEPLLRPMHHLKEFRYCVDLNALYEGPFETQVWVDALTKTVSGTLEVLSLTAFGQSTLTVKSFESFERLKELEIEVGSLVRDSEDDISISSDVEDDELETGFHQPVTKTLEQLVPRLVDILPASIETVQLFVGKYKDEALLLLRDIASEKHLLPNLKQINLGGLEINKTMKEELMSVGISVGRKQSDVYPDFVSFWSRDPTPYEDWFVGRTS